MKTRFAQVILLLALFGSLVAAVPPAPAFFGDNFPEASEIGNFQCARVEGKDSIVISGDFAQTDVPISTKLVLSRKKQYLTVLVRVAVSAGKSRGNRFEYNVKIPRGVDYVVFGRTKRLLWQREGK